MADAASNRIDSESFYDILPIGVMALARDRTIAIWNRQMEVWSGVPRSHALDRTLSQALPGFDDAAICDRMTAVIDGGVALEPSGTNLALPFPLQEGGRRTQRATVAPVSARDGARLAIFAIQDVSELAGEIHGLHTAMQEALSAARRAENAMRLAEKRSERLADLNQDLEQFAYLASHDLQEPLRTLTSFSTFLQSDLGEELPDAAAKDLDHIVAAAARMRRLIDGLLALSRVSRTEMTWTPASLGACVVEALESLEDGMTERAPMICGVDDLPTVNGDRRLLTQVFQNLLGNAVKFADASRPCQIRISAERDAAGWLVKTTDNGIGIADQYLSKVFAPFQRLHPADKYPGSGMGLAICKRAVERHGGTLWATPAEPYGVCFQFTLPYDQDQP